MDIETNKKWEIYKHFNLKLKIIIFMNQYN